jgi:hypothetical protein
MQELEKLSPKDSSGLTKEKRKNTEVLVLWSLLAYVESTHSTLEKESIVDRDCAVTADRQTPVMSLEAALKAVSFRKDFCFRRLLSMQTATSSLQIRLHIRKTTIGARRQPVQEDDNRNTAGKTVSPKIP